MTLEASVLAHRRKVMRRAAELGNVAQACREFGISRTLFYRWRRQFLSFGEVGLSPHPRVPQRWSRQSAPELEHAVLAYCLRWPTHGPQHIADQLRLPKFGGHQVSSSGVFGILRRHGLRTRWERLTRLEDRSAENGLLTERTRRRLLQSLDPGPHVEAKRPGDLVSVDTFYIGQLKGVGKVWQYTACDVASSFAVAAISLDHDSKTAAWFLKERVLPAYREAGHKLKPVLGTCQQL